MPRQVETLPVVIFDIDEGKPFDPRRDLRPDDRSLDLDDRCVGGLGWPLIQELCESIDYQLKGTTNVTTITVKLEDPEP